MIDRYILVIDGAPWRGTGPIVDWDHATRVPKGTYMIDYAGKIHWDGTKDENGAYLIAGIGPDMQTPAPKVDGRWAGGDPSAVTFIPPGKIQWKDNGGNRSAVLAGDPDKPGFYAVMNTWKKGNNFSRPHFHPNDRIELVDVADADRIRRMDRIVMLCGVAKRTSHMLYDVGSPLDEHSPLFVHCIEASA